MRGLHTHFPPHEPYIVANDCEYYTVGYACAIDDAVVMLIGKPCLDPFFFFIHILQFSFDIQLNQTLCANV